MFLAPFTRLSPQFDEWLPNQELFELLEGSHDEPLQLIEGSHDELCEFIEGNQDDDELEGIQLEEDHELDDWLENIDMPTQTPTPMPTPNTANTVDRGYSSTTCLA